MGETSSISKVPDSLHSDASLNQQIIKEKRDVSYENLGHDNFQSQNRFNLLAEGQEAILGQENGSVRSPNSVGANSVIAEPLVGNITMSIDLNRVPTSEMSSLFKETSHAPSSLLVPVRLEEEEARMATLDDLEGVKAGITSQILMILLPILTTR